MPKLQGRVGLLTGTATGIGRAGALLFASEGAALVTLDNNQAEGERTAEEIRQAGGRVTFVHGDVSDPAGVQRAVAAGVAEYGKLDLVWSNAGMGVYKTVPDTDLDEWDRIVAVNLKGAYLVGKYSIPEIVKAGGGTVVITGSVNSFVAHRQGAASCRANGGARATGQGTCAGPPPGRGPGHLRVPGIGGPRAAGTLAPGPLQPALRGGGRRRPGRPSAGALRRARRGGPDRAVPVLRRLALHHWFGCDGGRRADRPVAGRGAAP